MEVIELSSYTDEEKLQIAKQHLLPKQLKEHGLKKAPAAHQRRRHPRGHRGLYQGIRRPGAGAAAGQALPQGCYAAGRRRREARGHHRTRISGDLLGVAAIQPTRVHRDRDQVGVVNGLAWTQVGGEILEVEVNVMDGSGKLELTGNLGDRDAGIRQGGADAVCAAGAEELGIDPGLL